MKRSIIINSLILLLFSPIIVHAASIEGKVSMPASAGQISLATGTFEYREKILNLPPVENSIRPVVYLTGLNNTEDTKPQSFEPVHLDRLGIKGNNYWILKGSAITFINDDSIPVQVVVSSGQGRQEILTVKPDHNYNFTPEVAGTLLLSIKNHVNEHTMVLVSSSNYTVSLNNNNGFSIDNLPPGTATVNLWFNGEVLAATPVEIPDDGAVSVSFAPDEDGVMVGEEGKKNAKK